MTERSSLLNRRRENNQQHYNALNDVSPISSFPSTPSIGDIQANNNSAPATFITASHGAHNQHGSSDHHKFKLFNKRHGSYDEDRQGLIKENTGVRVWYESYSTIDWIHDHIKEGLRLRRLRETPGLRGRWMKAKDASQAWILVILTGATVAVIAGLIDVVQEWMSDLKGGYCTTNWRYNSKFCCWGKQEYEPCPAWRTWPEVFGASTESGAYYTAMFMYTAVGLVLALIATLMVKYSAEKVTFRTPATKPTNGVTPSGTQSTIAKDGDMPPPKPQTKIAYYSAGSGIPEVKVILAGFVIKGFLGIKTLFVKSVGMIFSTSSGLNCGKEGPFVHLACSAGNIFCRLFRKFNKNESKRREILSAASAAGVAVAFGAPIGGVLFSLEEVSYYFPIKTMIRSYCAAMVAAMVLKLMDPFGTGKIVLFQVHYDKEYHVFELVPFLITGAFAGFFGAVTTYYNIKYQHLRKNTIIGKYPVTEVLVILLVTAITSFWNPFARLGLNEFAYNLFSECSPEDDNAGLCAHCDRNPSFTLPPADCLGDQDDSDNGYFWLPRRVIGLIMQYLTLTYPDTWPFSVCEEDLATQGKCIIPGVYAMVGAAAALAGVTRTTVSLVIIMFELTFSLVYAVPIMISVMMAKWVADAMFVEGIYDLLIDLQLYPYLDARKEYAHTHTVQDLSEKDHLSINLDQINTAGNLYDKLDEMDVLGYREDGGIPILSSQGRYLEGYIATSELSHALDVLRKHFDESPYPMGEQEFRDIPCYFRRGSQGVLPDTSDDVSSSILCLISSKSTHGDNADDIDTEQRHSTPLNDFSVYVDQAPLTLSPNASMELLMEMFTKLGARYVCLVGNDGQYLGIVHKRTLIAYLKELEED
ncbi:clc channel [Lichtheimia corymbifera JMRC:FSU:9682]|uniref:Chloride channel protein n=1 Tax=Lichtheimia corymbifera JMRC:FSU:9682 TaxID=1263082 RepID=A0A068S834_9FUNG|nr:clc channel [Lichtheimia corymbifera JMRC:FSU:9682]